MANRIVSVHAGIYGMGIHVYAIIVPSSGFSVAYYFKSSLLLIVTYQITCTLNTGTDYQRLFTLSSTYESHRIYLW